MTETWETRDPQLIRDLLPQTVENLASELGPDTSEIKPGHDYELRTAIVGLLDSALHGPECWIDPDETHCECLIGQVRSAL